MTFYTKYDLSTGEIEFTFEGRLEDAMENQPFVEGRYSAKEFTVVDGQAVRKANAVIKQAELDFAQAEFRRRRDGYLKDSDWTQVPDAPIDQEAWAVYRQALRDLPTNTTDTFNVEWPKSPKTNKGEPA